MRSESLQILFADDQENDRLLFLDALKEIKVKTTTYTVNDGVELMEYLTNDDNVMPHLLFLDINMPKKNGIECLKEIKSNAKFRDITIAIFSTSMSENDIEETLVNGANVYITKPNSFDKLKEVVHRVVTTAYTYQNMFFNKAHFLMVL